MAAPPNPSKSPKLVGGEIGESKWELRGSGQPPGITAALMVDGELRGAFAHDSQSWSPSVSRGEAMFGVSVDGRGNRYVFGMVPPRVDEVRIFAEDGTSRSAIVTDTSPVKFFVDVAEPGAAAATTMGMYRHGRPVLGRPSGSAQDVERVPLERIGLSAVNVDPSLFS